MRIPSYRKQGLACIIYSEEEESVIITTIVVMQEKKAVNNKKLFTDFSFYIIYIIQGRKMIYLKFNHCPNSPKLSVVGLFIQHDYSTQKGIDHSTFYSTQKRD